ncbi:hypothetical protein Tco_1316406 [Tanacetum coccineum]
MLGLKAFLKLLLLSTASSQLLLLVYILALAELKSAKPKAEKVVIQEPEQGTTTPIVSSQQPSQVKAQDKGKGIMVEEPVLQAEEEEEEERLGREKAQQMEEANIAWDDVQAKINVDYQLAQRLQAQEQDELTDKEKARLFVQFLKQRRKHFAAKRAEEKRNKPPTRAQQRSIMCTYLKNMEGWKPKDLKNKSFANIQELFDKAMKRVNTFVDYRIELVEESYKKAETEMEENSKKAKAEIAQESSSKRAGDELEQENEKKSIKRKKSYFQIIRAMGKTQMYLLLENLSTYKSYTTQMFNDVKLQVDYECEMAFELLRLLSMKKLEILKKNIKFRGGLLGLKAFLKLLYSLGISSIVDAFVRSEFGISSWRGSRVDVPLSYESVDVVIGENWLLRHKAEMSKEEYESHVKMIVESVKEEKMYVKFSNNEEAEQRGSYLDVEGIKWDLEACLEKREKVIACTSRQLKIIMVNVIPPDHVDDVLVVEPNQHDDVPVVSEPVLVDEDEEPEED